MPSARSRWTRSKPPSPDIPACRWAWPTSRSRCGTGTCVTTRRIPHWPDRDRFVLSNGHGSMLQYALLHLTGYDLPMQELRNFRQLHSKTPGHPEVGVTPGVETTTGPLGQGLANAVGMALAEALLAQEFNRPGHTIVDHRTYVFLGDGCLMEGVSHEACSLAGTLEARQARRVLRRQRHLHRRPRRRLVHRRHAAALRSVRLARDPARRRPRRRGRRRGDQGRAGRRRPAVAHLLQDDHRQGRAEQGRHRARARRRARREGSRGGARRARLDLIRRSRSRRRSTPRGTRANAARCSKRTGTRNSPPIAPRIRRCAAEFDAPPARRSARRLRAKPPRPSSPRRPRRARRSPRARRRSRPSRRTRSCCRR